MKNLKMLIGILIILAIFLAIALIILNTQNSNSDEINNKTNMVNTLFNNLENNVTNNAENNTDVEAPELTFNTSLQEVTGNSMLYSISKNVNKFFQYIKEGNVQAVNELGGNNTFFIQNDVQYVAKQAYSTENAYMSKYYTYGLLTVANGNFTSKIQDVYAIVYLTGQNQAYKIQTITKEEFANMKALELEEKIEIPQGTYNTYEYEYVDNVKQMEIYLQDYSFQIFNNTDNAYNLLDEEYRNERFGNINEFVNYISQKQNQLQNIKITQYNATEEDNETVYIGTDDYGNFYKIIETDYMQYTIILDNYTLDDYTGYSEEEQIKGYAEKFILMLNSLDYTNAYNVLEPTFKATYFPTQQDFENYVKQNFFERNVIATREVIEEGVCVVTMRENISTTSNKLQKMFKVIIGEAGNFTIEFNL